MTNRLWQIMVLFLFLLLLSSCIIKVDTEKNSLVFVPRLQQQQRSVTKGAQDKNNPKKCRKCKESHFGRLRQMLASLNKKFQKSMIFNIFFPKTF